MRLIILLTLISTSVFADRYTEMMKKNIEAVYKAETVADLQTVVNSLERIGAAEKTKWEPYYYAAFGYMMMATQEKDGTKKDGFLDQAAAAVRKAMDIKSDESELFAMEGFVHMIRLTVDPASRGQQYSMLSVKSYEKALELNPSNPRALGLLAQMQLGTARFFNQAPTEACETANKALAIFDAQKPDPDSLLPNWGRGMTAEVTKACQ